jgi:hypothetical protein
VDKFSRNSAKASFAKKLQYPQGAFEWIRNLKPERQFSIQSTKETKKELASEFK